MRRATLLALVVLVASAATAQAPTGTILGTVTDGTGAVLPGTEIVLTHVGTNIPRTVITGGGGAYSAPNLAVGDYTVVATLPGFQTDEARVTLQIGSSQRIDFEMRVGAVTTRVDVTAEVPLIETDTSSVGSVIDSDTILTLPLNGRKFETLTQLLPGAVIAAQGSEIGTRGGFNISGYDENFNSFYLDGFDNVDPILRNILYRPTLDSLQEFRVIQNSYKAEYGRNAGAVITATTKSGTNAFHGTVWEFLRNDNLDARNVFAPSDLDQPDLIRNQFGASFGGPIARDRSFFFVAYEGLREKRGETHRAFVPTTLMRQGNFSEVGQIVDPVTGTPFPGNTIPLDRFHPVTAEVLAAYPLPNVAGAAIGTPNRIEIANHIENTDEISGRVDQSLPLNTQMAARYSFSDTRLLDPFRSDTPGGTNLKDFGQSNDIIRTNTGVSFTSTIDANLIHEFRFGYGRFTQPQLPLRDLPALQAPLAGFNKTFLDFRPTGFDSIGSGRRFARVVNTYNYIDQIYWSHGDHQFKFGVDVRRYLFNASSAQPNRFDFDGFRSGNPLADMILGFPSLTVGFDGDPTGNPRKTEAAAYIQDDWQVTSNLTLNYGLRYEWYGRIEENVNKQSNWDAATNSIVIAGQGGTLPQLVDDDYNNWAPRLGFAWRPFSGDDTVIRGGGGIYYDSQMRHNFLQIAHVPFLTTSVYPAAALEQFFNVTLTMDDPLPAGGGFPNVLPFGLEKDFRDSYSTHWNLGVQHELFPDTVLDVAYVGNRFAHLQRIRNVNQPINGQRPYAGFGPILLQEQAGSSNYHALQVRAEGSPISRLRFISSYTWGHAIDDRPGQAAASMVGFTGFQDDTNPGKDRASADFDVRHKYNLSFVYQLPRTSYDGAAGQVLNGWGITSILTLQSGRPFTVSMPGAGEIGLRPDAVEGVDPVPASQGPNNWINAAAFMAPAGTFGTLGRNTLTGPGLRNLDFSVLKDFQVGEARSLQFRGEFFNLTNHPNYGLPSAQFGTPNFGVISTTVTAERQIQLGLRYEF